MSDQPSDSSDLPGDRSGEPADQPIDPPTRPADDARDRAERASGPPPIAETIRAKLEEYDVERHLEDFAAQAEQLVRQGVETVAALAHEHRADVEGFLSRTAEALDRRTDGRHAETINQVRGQLERGMDRIAEQRPGDAGTAEEE